MVDEPCASVLSVLALRFGTTEMTVTTRSVERRHRSASSAGPGEILCLCGGVVLSLTAHVSLTLAGVGHASSINWLYDWLKQNDLMALRWLLRYHYWLLFFLASVGWAYWSWRDNHRRATCRRLMTLNAAIVFLPLLVSDAGRGVFVAVLTGFVEVVVMRQCTVIGFALWPLKASRYLICGTCGYNLYGNESGRCPECGSGVAPSATGSSAATR